MADGFDLQFKEVKRPKAARVLAEHQELDTILDTKRVKTNYKK